ncbi:MAG TPA: alpha-ketoglutarate-dependent dioxygenase AlkB [Miltoncostaeaceae bacterium]|nr:alpha-ketoglutarate-dependent dioxygenase AlkB [Miltoncostaeaceae bacterium]
MPRAPVVPPPEGLVFTPDLLSPGEEAALLRIVDGLDYDPIEIRGVVARRTARHYGVGYDYATRTAQPGALPIPEWLEDLRARGAGLAGLPPEELAEALVQRYPPGATIGWHRDAPAFEVVVGVSLASACRLRFQRGRGDARRVAEVALPARSAYVLTGPARWSWEHSIPPTPALRYSITFRTLRRARA